MSCSALCCEKHAHLDMQMMPHTMLTCLVTVKSGATPGQPLSVGPHLSVNCSEDLGLHTMDLSRYLPPTTPLLFFGGSKSRMVSLAPK